MPNSVDNSNLMLQRSGGKRQYISVKVLGVTFTHEVSGVSALCLKAALNRTWIDIWGRGRADIIVACFCLLVDAFTFPPILPHLAISGAFNLKAPLTNNRFIVRR